jgi:squalene-hopene/tetraprenyl-beta-curcumene cyclase
MRIRPTVRCFFTATIALATTLAVAQSMPTATPESTTLATTRHTLDADPLKRADQLIESGLAFLKTRQNADGSWGETNDPPAITALALRAFADNGQSKLDFAERGFQRLLSYQLEDGGIYRDLLANYNTAIAITALVAADNPDYQPAITKAVAYLKGLQWTGETRPEYVSKPNEKTPEENRGMQVVKDESDPFYGGWGYGGRSRGAGRPDLSNAQLAIDALHEAGVDKTDPAMQRAIAFLSRVQNNSETNDQVWAGDDGGFVYGPAGDRTGESMAGEYTDASGRRVLRSYGSMTYAGLKSMIHAGLTKDDPRVRAAVGWISSNWTLDENPGMGLGKPEDAKAGLYYYYHTLGRALHAYGEPTLTLGDGNRVDWRVALIDKLASLQAADGSWSGEKRWMEHNPILVTSYAVQALQAAREDLKARPAE